jgi:hypothetical protein
VEQSEQDVLQNFITAATKGIDDPTPENIAAADAIWDQLGERWKQLPPVDQTELTRVAEWLDLLESGKINAPDKAIQAAIEFAKGYLSNPTEEDRLVLDIIRFRLDELDKPKEQSEEELRRKYILENIIRPILDKLTERQKTIFHLKAWRYSIPEIAEILDIDVRLVYAEWKVIKETAKPFLRVGETLNIE